jgi:hypothetical protein
MASKCAAANSFWNSSPIWSLGRAATLGQVFGTSTVELIFAVHFVMEPPLCNPVEVTVNMSNRFLNI